MKKYSVNDAVWIATALMAAEVYTNNREATKEEMYFKQSEIVKRAQELTENKVDSARVSWWLNADNEKATHNYLRGDSKDNAATRRLALIDEFTEKTYPDGLDMSDKFEMLNQEITMEELFFFVKEQYSSLICDTKDGFWPSLDEYNPKLTKEMWIDFLEEVEKPDHPSPMKMLVGMMELGGQASCKQLAEAYGGAPSVYVGCTTNLGKRAMKYFNIPGCMDGDKERVFVLPFQGKHINDENGGSSVY